MADNFKIAKNAKEYMAFANKYHEDTIAQKKAMRNKDGTPTTVNATGIEIDGYIATVPFYDRDLGRNLTQQEARAKYEPLIRQGAIPVVPAKMAVPKEQHPANVWPRTNHGSQAYDPKRVEGAIGYDYSKKPSLGQAPKTARKNETR